jgi:hypothetical protein
MHACLPKFLVESRKGNTKATTGVHKEKMDYMVMMGKRYMPCITPRVQNFGKISRISIISVMSESKIRNFVIS